MVIFTNPACDTVACHSALRGFASWFDLGFYPRRCGISGLSNAKEILLAGHLYTFPNGDVVFGTGIPPRVVTTPRVWHINSGWTKRGNLGGLLLGNGDVNARIVVIICLRV